MAKIIDVLLAARPDHSYSIYQQLSKSEYSFLYVTFKLLPQWFGKLFPWINVRTVDKHYSISWLMTLVNWLRYNRNIRLNVKESSLFSRHLRAVLKRVNPKIIHYWPDYFANIVHEYSLSHPDVFTIADIYFPCRQFIIDNMSSDFKQYGLENQLETLKNGIQRYDRLMKIEHNFLVPSNFVADSYKKYYPENHFHVVSYGIEKWVGYQKKETFKAPMHFVYVGTVSIAKGCDVLCRWFKLHSDYHLHLYGKIPVEESHLFIDYEHLSNIHFEGHVDKIMVQSTVSVYDAGIHLSRFDAYSLAVSEMIGCGLPVIVSCYTGNSEDILQNQLGLITELKMDVIDQAVKTLIDNYNYYVDKIDKYLSTPHLSYQEKIIEFYNNGLNRKNTTSIY